MKVKKTTIDDRSISRFLVTTTPISDLRAALAVIREFKGCESLTENMLTPHYCWVKLEQLEEFLAHLVDGDPLEEDTINHLEGTCDHCTALEERKS